MTITTKVVALFALLALVLSFEQPHIKSRVSLVNVRKTLLNTAAVAVCATAVAANAVEISKSDFLGKASQGVSIERSLKQRLEDAKAQERKDAESAAPVEGVRLIDLGGSRGARGLASNGVQGGSLVDQLKAYGGPGANEEKTVKLVDGKSQRVDNSIKNPLKYKNEFEEQLKLYQQMNGK